MIFSEIDFLILDFVKSNSPASLDKILEKFPESDFNTHFRLKQLQSEKYIDFLLTSTGYKIDCFVIRPQGISALQDHNWSRAKELKLRYIDYVWKFAPIIISLIALGKSFAPEIKELLKLLQ